MSSTSSRPHRNENHFADRLEAAVARCGNPCLVGLDPHLDGLPEEFARARDASVPRAERARAIADFLTALIDVAAERVAAVKPQSAFFEIFGADGAAAWERVVGAAHDAGLIVIGDVKRGDIDSTARAYARAFLEGPDGVSTTADDERARSAAALSAAARSQEAAIVTPNGAHAHDTRRTLCDAITVNPLLGPGTIQPFLESCRAAGGGIYVLVRTSNKDSALFQEHGTPPLFERIADAVASAGRELVGASGLSSVGAVIGATQPRELAMLRARLPATPFLLPGYGAQGAGAKDIAAGFLPGGRGALVNSSRGIAFAYREPQYRGLHWKDATKKALDAMIREVNAVVPRD
jgi:orotidine-5'-phosphate decarboxylase